MQRIVLLAVFKAHNTDLSRQAGERAMARYPQLSIAVFSDGDRHRDRELLLLPFVDGQSDLFCSRRKPEPPWEPRPASHRPEPAGSEHRDGAQPPGLQLASPLMGQSRRHEPGLFDRATTTAIEDREALSTGGLAATGINMHQQLADFAAGGRGGQHERGEGHPRQASAVAARRDETAGAAVPGPR